MKYCEKCGNKIKDGYLFCDKCGTKVRETEEVVKEKKKEKKEEKIVEAPVVPVPIPPKKKGKGKIVFLTILNILLLASTVTFMILWLTKPTDSDKSCPKCEEKVDPTPEPTPEPKKTKSYVGKWEQNVEYKEGTKVVKRTYGLIELKEDGSFYSLYYDKDSISTTKEEIRGTYTVKNNVVKLSYSSGTSKETTELTIEDDKMCLNDKCSNYLKKEGNNKITIYDDSDYTDDIDFITYSEYEKLQKDYKDAIVVVVKDGCSACENFKDVVEKIDSFYSTSVYYYKYDGKISVSVTPTTIIIKNGYVVDSVEGYKDYIDMADILDELGVK